MVDFNRAHPSRDSCETTQRNHARNRTFRRAMDVLKSPTESNLKNFSIDSILQNPFPVHRLDPVQASAKISFPAVGYLPNQQQSFPSAYTPAAVASAPHCPPVGLLNSYFLQNALQSVESGILPSVFPVFQEIPGVSMNTRLVCSELGTHREAPKNNGKNEQARNPQKKSDTLDYSDEELGIENATSIIVRNRHSPQRQTVEEYDGSSSSNPPSPHNVERKGRFKKARTSFTQLQIQSLEIKFDHQKYLARKDRTNLALGLGLTEKHVKTWFQNRRTKWKRECSEENWSKYKEMAAAMMYSQYVEEKKTWKVTTFAYGHDRYFLFIIFFDWHFYFIEDTDIYEKKYV